MIFHQPHNSLSNYQYNAFTYSDTVWQPHFHKNFELVYVIKGAIDCTINNTPYTLQPGQFGLCLPYDVHSYFPRPDTLYWVLVFAEDYVRYVERQFFQKKSGGFPFCCQQAVKEYLCSQIIGRSEISTLTLKSCLYAVMEEFLNQVPLISKTKAESRTLPFLTDYVAKNHTKKLTLTDISRELGYDYSYMSRYFRSTFNMTFTDFVNIYRLETALKLLEQGDKSITVIALESGFQSVRSFNSFFKKNMDMSPSAYRKAQIVSGAAD